MLINTSRTLFASYKGQIQLMADLEVSDNQKQKMLLENVWFQIKHLSILLGKLALSLLPFVFLWFSGNWISFDKILLFQPGGILVSLLAVGSYVLIKKVYGKLFRHQ